MEKNYQPPKWAQRFVEWYCKPRLAEDLIGDLNEYFERNVERIGVRRARLIYIIDAFKFFRPYTVRAPKFINLFINWIMIGSYFKTSARNVMRNKLFSFINIVGLAISMSVGLILIGFLHDMLSYEKFHDKGARIYRLWNHPSFNKELSNRFASTSVRAGKLVKEKVSGIEDVTLFRNDFGGDAKFDDKVIPVNGFWADNSFLKILTFPMVEGDANTALKEPYSLVLTQATAKKLFGDSEALGKTVHIDTLDYHVTGVIKDIPFLSYLKFESLASFATIDNLEKDSKNFNDWRSMWSNYVYLLLPENADLKNIQSQLDAIAKEENKRDENTTIQLGLQPMSDFVLGEDMSNSPGPTMQPIVLWIIGGLAFVVVLSACFNYTNLSIARSMRRFKEIGLRKVIGAGKSQVRQQFLAEAIIVSVAALILSFLMFLVLRPQFINMAPEMQNMVKLELTPIMVIAFVVFAIAVGVMAGLFPAIFFSNVGIIKALRNSSTVKVFKHLSLRRALVIVQYTFTMIFITATAIGYTQYKDILSFDLGFNTANILNIRMAGNNADNLIKAFEEIPEVVGVSKSLMITSVGNYWGGHMKYHNDLDSALVWYNKIDENYLPLHDHKLIAGRNFITHPSTEKESTEVIVNEEVLRHFDIAKKDAEKALGEVITIDMHKYTIVGVMKDFHYGKVENKIDPVVMMMYVPEKNGFINMKIQSTDIIATRAKIESAWKEIDKTHPIEAVFYSDAIEKAYSEFSAMIKIIGFLSFLAISIASMGLFGMVVFTTETRLKEISIRKVMGASSGNLVFLLSRGFLILLSISAALAIPATYFFFEGVVLTKFPYHNPIRVTELFSGLLMVFVIAIIMIGTQTMKAARSNPAEVLKGE
jgi:putative ABC transport system permease protein